MRYSDVIAGQVEALTADDIDGAIDLIRSAPLRELRDPLFLEHEFLLQIGLHENSVGEYPQSLSPWLNKGIKSWQYPNQFAKLLSYLADKPIKSYLEIGVRFGGTFIIVLEYLRRFHDVYRATAVDLVRQDIMDRYVMRTAGVEYRIADSTTSETRAFLSSAPWDLAFIDGDHSYEACMVDYQSVKNRSKWIVFHDIVNDVCPGTIQVWQEFKRMFPTDRLFEAIDQYAEVRQATGKNFLGIGVLDLS